MPIRPQGAGAVLAAAAPFLLAFLLLSLPARGGEAATEGSGPSDPAGLDAYDPLFDDETLHEKEMGQDPFEPANRATFAFNERLDRWVLDPLTRGYQWLVPGPARRGLHRFFLNLNSPVVFTNEVLQLRPNAAGATLGRFIANTTLGVGGFLDVAASEMDIPRNEADFGQTLSRYGVPRGPYLVVPVFGPATARDAVGRIVDQGLAPLTYLFGPLNLQWQVIRGGGQGLVLRDQNMDALDALRDASVDYYAALRSAYLQSRRAMEIEARWRDPWGEPGGENGAPAGPDGSPPVAEPVGQDSVPAASFSMRSSMAAISASKSSRFTMPENSERRSASSLTVPSR